MEWREVANRLRAVEDKEIGGGVFLQEIVRTEEKLSVQLPGSYKAFLNEFGWAVIGHYEVFGLGQDVPDYMNVIAVTYDERFVADNPLPFHLIPILNDGAGNLHCLDTRQFVQDECPVVFWDHELGVNQEPDRWADNFAMWLNERIDIISQQTE
jgi:hypothetical protein